MHFASITFFIVHVAIRFFRFFVVVVVSESEVVAVVRLTRDSKYLIAYSHNVLIVWVILCYYCDEWSSSAVGPTRLLIHKSIRCVRYFRHCAASESTAVHSRIILFRHYHITLKPRIIYTSIRYANGCRTCRIFSSMFYGN